ncbi:MAG: ferrous iron transport protein B [Saprospiraceae bacterium]|nr:ferrous iron transport protein B [Saprospiraceae bacterium]
MSQAPEQAAIRVALVGNPNSGKSTVFNQLTGLRQKTGNFPGVTVDVKEGKIKLPSGREAMLTDFPGTYSLYPTSSDEKIVASVMTNPADLHYPRAVIYVADAINLEKHLLLLSQLIDLGLPVLLALNMADTAAEMGIKVNLAKLSDSLGVPVVFISGRTGENIQKLIVELEKLLLQAEKNPSVHPPFYRLTESEKQVVEAVRLNLGADNPYRALLLAHHADWLPFLQKQERDTLAAITETKQFQSLRAQVDETLDRYDTFSPLIQEAVQRPPVYPSTPTDRLDNVLTHRWWGPMIFFGVMLLVFMVIFYGYETTGGWVEAGMNWVIDGMGSLAHRLGGEWIANLITKGILEGFKGVLVFVPQIALLFFLVTILEEVGYLARVVFMFDKTMRRYGMNGRSIVALIGGGACAVPAIMGTRTISNWKERLITVMVTPFISCSARIPVYMVLIPVALPGAGWWTWALVFAAMYFLGMGAAFGSAWLLKKTLRTREPSYLALEMPVYRMPHWKNVWLTVWDKTTSFVSGVWKIIVVITVSLWILSSTGPGDAMLRAESAAREDAALQGLDSLRTNDLIAAYQMKDSWAGRFGSFIEPAIRPLGYDWKIGIGLISSFAAREVFNSTMYVIYSLESVGEQEEEDAADQKPFERYISLRQRMLDDRFDDTDTPVYTRATGLSLLVFYALAMQCMSTLAAVRRETGRWRWAILQFVGMGLVAYLGAWVVQQIF